jgi:hypothetical protein
LTLIKVPRHIAALITPKYAFPEQWAMIDFTIPYVDSNFRAIGSVIRAAWRHAPLRNYAIMPYAEPFDYAMRHATPRRTMPCVMPYAMPYAALRSITPLRAMPRAAP